MTETTAYFAANEPAGDAGKKGAWYDLARDITPFEMLPGLSFQPAPGENLLINYVSFEPNVEAPVHSHEEEQVSFVLEGEVEFEVSGEVRTIRKGMMVIIPPHAPHGARTRDSRCVCLDVFSPPRRALLKHLESAQAHDG
jgi:quercetin dioxygenase-like cupin family protein